MYKNINNILYSINTSIIIGKNDPSCVLKW